MQVEQTAAGVARHEPVARRRDHFFLIAAAVMSLVIFVGFLPSFFLRYRFHTTSLPVNLIVHATVMTAWQLLFLAQTILVAAGRTDLHRRLGIAGAGLAIAVIVVGIDATLRQPGRLAASGFVLPFPVEMLVIGNLFGFAVFGGLVATAIVRRRDSGSHRRLIYWACLMTMGPALTPSRSLGRAILPYFPTTFPPEIALGWVGWIALLANDWRTARRFHPVTIVGGVLILFVAPALVDWLLLVDAVSAWARAPG